ncbi:MAG: pilus assembly protein PilM [Oscillospiraceae bacterium]
MLSFDITDRNIRIIRGTEIGGKIKIQSSNSIENGYIKDIPQMATIINNGLKERKMNDKDAVVSISSNLVMFKELHVPKAKPAQFKTMVQNQMQQSMAVTTEHCIAYTVVGEIEEEGSQELKVLATSCPRDVVDCYKKVFSMLGIALKSVSVSCNCISRVVLADPKVKDRMPLLLVQIDPNFINMNIYENGHLSFSRFASISVDDYDDKTDYMFQAVNENIFRMFQFQRTRSQQTIKNVVFYGDTAEFIRLTNALEQMDVSAQLLKIPPQLSGYENLEFSLYANAIGAMYKRQKDVESTNLLTVDTGTMNQMQVSGSSVAIQIGLTAAISLGVVLAGWGGCKFIASQIKNDIEEIDSYIASEEVINQLSIIEKKETMLAKIDVYKSLIGVAKSGFDSKPILNTSLVNDLVACMPSTDVKFTEISYTNGMLEVSMSAAKKEEPALFVQKLTELEKYENITYVGYSSSTEEGAATGGGVGPDGTPIPVVAGGGEGGFEFAVAFQMKTPLEDSLKVMEEAKNRLNPPAVTEAPVEAPAEN